MCGYFLANFGETLATFYSIIWSHWYSMDDNNFLSNLQSRRQNFQQKLGLQFWSPGCTVCMLLTMEVFSKRIWRLASAQVSNKVSYCASWTFSTVLFKNMAQTWPLFVYFCPFLNTLTNIVQNLTINRKM